MQHDQIEWILGNKKMGVIQGDFGLEFPLIGTCESPVGYS